jgi:hypothetical protein
VNGKLIGIAGLAKGIPDPPPPPPDPGHEFVDQFGGVVVPVFVLHVFAFSITITLREIIAVFHEVFVYV